jgi:hypothetical protein
VIELVAIYVPCGIPRAIEQFGHVGPLPPRARCSGYEFRAGSPSHGDRDLLAVLNATDELGGVLT